MNKCRHGIILYRPTKDIFETHIESIIEERTMPEPTLLATVNHDPMDVRIQFDEPTHIYTIDGDSNYTSVTTFIHQHFPHFDAEKVSKNLLRPSTIYNGRTYPNTNAYRTTAFNNTKNENPSLSDDEINALLNDHSTEQFKKEAKKITDEWSQSSSSGTKTHMDIEWFYNELPVENDTKEYEYFKKFNEDFKKEFPQYRPYRTEWTVFYKEIKLAGSIDMVYENTEDGTLMIYDWKRVKRIDYEAYKNDMATNPVLDGIPNSNFWHYSLQLNTYKAILESQYGKKVTKLMLVRLHPDAPSYELHECADLQDKVLTLFDNRRKEINI